MDDHSPTPQIRIKFAHPQAHREEPVREVQEYIYHWDRIIGALTALLLVLGALGYGLYSWLTPSSAPAEAGIRDRSTADEMIVAEPPQREEATSATTSSSSQRLPAEGPARSPFEIWPAGIADVPESKTPDSNRPSPEPVSELNPKKAATDSEENRLPPPAETTDSSAEVAEGEALEMSPSSESSPKTTMPPIVRREETTEPTAKTPASQSNEMGTRPPGQESVGESAPGPSAADGAEKPPGEAMEVVVKPESGDVAADAHPSGHRSDEGLLRSPKTSILSPAVKRFVLAKDVVGHEPKGDIGDIAIHNGRYAEVSSFSEVIDQEGETLQYRWLHEGKEVLRIRVPVGSKRWRSYSTKRIYTRMKGRWRAELRNSEGALLASIDFTY